MYAILAYFITYFGQAKDFVRQVKIIHELLAQHGKLVLKLKLLPVNILQPPLLMSLPKSFGLPEGLF